MEKSTQIAPESTGEPKDTPHTEVCAPGAPRNARVSTLVTHTVRTRDFGTKTLKYGRKQAIYLMCVECQGWENHPNDCTSPLCPLFPFRGSTMASQHSKKQPF